MFCSKCGKEISDQAKFCNYCGNPVNTVPPKGAPQPQAALQAAPQPTPAPAKKKKGKAGKRILFTRESTGAKNATMVARMDGGLVGSLIAEGVKAASGAGPKPWLEIPLTAVSCCGILNKKEFFIVADQAYVLKNRSFEKFLPALVESAK